MEAGMLCTGDEFFSNLACLSVFSSNSHFSYGQFGTLTLTKMSLFIKTVFAFDAILQRSQKSPLKNTDDTKKKVSGWSDEGRKPVVHTFGNRRWASVKPNNLSFLPQGIVGYDVMVMWD